MKHEESVQVHHFKLVLSLDLDGQERRIEVTPRAMVQCFGAQMTPGSILTAYEQNCSIIRKAAYENLAADSQVVILDTPELRPFLQSIETAASPCIVAAGAPSWIRLAARHPRQTPYAGAALAGAVHTGAARAGAALDAATRAQAACAGAVLTGSAVVQRGVLSTQGSAP